MNEDDEQIMMSEWVQFAIVLLITIAAFAFLLGLVRCGFPSRRSLGHCRARLDLRPVFPDTGCGEEHRLF